MNSLLFGVRLMRIFIFAAVATFLQYKLDIAVTPVRLIGIAGAVDLVISGIMMAMARLGTSSFLIIAFPAEIAFGLVAFRRHPLSTTIAIARISINVAIVATAFILPIVTFFDAAFAVVLITIIVLAFDYALYKRGF